MTLKHQKDMHNTSVCHDMTADVIFDAQLSPLTLPQRLKLRFQLFHRLLLVINEKLRRPPWWSFNFLPSNSLSCCTPHSSMGQPCRTPLLAQRLQEGGRRHGSNALTSDAVNVMLALLRSTYSLKLISSSPDLEVW